MYEQGRWATREGWGYLGDVVDTGGSVETTEGHIRRDFGIVKGVSARVI